MVVDHQHAVAGRLAGAVVAAASAAGRSISGRSISGELAGAAIRVSVTVKVEPAPGVLSTDTSPPISWARRRTIERPRPVPPKRRVVELSAWEKGWNSRACCASFMPMPVSLTDSTTRVRAVAQRLGAGADHGAAALGELERVAEQVEQDLAHARGIADQRVGRARRDGGDQRQALALGLRPEGRDRAVDQAGQRERRSPRARARRPRSWRSRAGRR